MFHMRINQYNLQRQSWENKLAVNDSILFSKGKAGGNKLVVNDGLLKTTSNEYLGAPKRRYRIILEFNVMTNLNMRDISYVYHPV